MKTKSFTLVEVLVAMGIFMVGIAPLLGVVMSLTRNYQDNLAKNNMASYALKKIDELKLSPLAPTPVTTYKATGQPGLSYLLQVDYVFPNYRYVTLAVGPTDLTPTPTLDNILLQRFSYLHYQDAP